MKSNFLRQYTACRLLVFLLFPIGWSIADIQNGKLYTMLSSHYVVSYCYLDEDTGDDDWKDHSILSSSVTHPTEIISRSSLRSLLRSVYRRAYVLDLQTSWQDRAPPLRTLILRFLF